MILICLLLGLVLVAYVYLTWNFDYWAKRGVVSAKARLVLGNLPNLLLRREHITYDFDRLYECVWRKSWKFIFSNFFFSKQRI